MTIPVIRAEGQGHLTNSSNGDFCRNQIPNCKKINKQLSVFTGDLMQPARFHDGVTINERDGHIEGELLANNERRGT